MAKIRYRKRPRTAGTAATGGVGTPAAEGTAGAAKEPVKGSFEMSDEEAQNPKEIPTPADIPTTHLDDVKKEHPGLSDSYGRLIVNAQNYRDKKKDELAAKKDNYLRTYLSSWEKAESDEDKAARERREKKARRWAAVGDAVAALANIGGAMGGATPMQINKPLSQAQMERMEYARKLRQAEQKRLDDQNKKSLDKASKEYDAALKGLDSAEKNVQNQKYRAMMLQNTAQNQEAAAEKAKEAQDLAEKKAEQQKEYQGKMAGIAQQNANTNAARAAETANYHGQMVGIAQQKANNSGHGSKKDDWKGRYLRYSYENEDRYNKWENKVDENGMPNRYKYPNETSRRMQFAASEMNQPKVTPKKPAGGGKKPVATGGGKKPVATGGGWASGLNKGKKK